MREGSIDRRHANSSLLSKRHSYLIHAHFRYLANRVPDVETVLDIGGGKVGLLLGGRAMADVSVGFSEYVLALRSRDEATVAGDVRADFGDDDGMKILGVFVYVRH